MIHRHKTATQHIAIFVGHSPVVVVVPRCAAAVWTPNDKVGYHFDCEIGCADRTFAAGAHTDRILLGDVGQADAERVGIALFECKIGYRRIRRKHQLRCACRPYDEVLFVGLQHNTRYIFRHEIGVVGRYQQHCVDLDVIRRIDRQIERRKIFSHPHTANLILYLVFLAVPTERQVIIATIAQCERSRHHIVAHLVAVSTSAVDGNDDAIEV